MFIVNDSIFQVAFRCFLAVSSLHSEAHLSLVPVDSAWMVVLVAASVNHPKSQWPVLFNPKAKAKLAS